jgi:hypothetical protein
LPVAGPAPAPFQPINSGYGGGTAPSITPVPPAPVAGYNEQQGSYSINNLFSTQPPPLPPPPTTIAYQQQQVGSKIKQLQFFL